MQLLDVTTTTANGTPYRIKKTCRLCGAPVEKFLDLGETPLANELLDSAEASLGQERFPLFLAKCEACDHIQMPVVVDPERLFRQYPYVSGTSPVFVQHLAGFARTATDDWTRKSMSGMPILRQPFVVEIGSNDGTLLRLFKQYGWNILGVDPARNIAEKANQAGITTITDFFTPATARKILERAGKADLIVAKNVFAHAEDLAGMLDGIAMLLAPDGFFTFEVGYWYSMAAAGAFDLAYHEHLSFHHVRALARFLGQAGFEIASVGWVATQGGSLRVTARLGAFPERGADVFAGLKEPVVPDVVEFARKALVVAECVRTRLVRLKEEGSKIAVFGCPAKLATLASFCGITSGLVDYAVEENPLKHGKFVPGTGIPIVAVDRLFEDPPDYIFLAAWNFADDVMKRFAGPWKWIVPLPEFRVV